MKKLLYTLLAVSIIFSACEEEDAAPANTNNNTVHPDNLGLAIGDFHQGGIIFYLDNINGGGLVAADYESDVEASWGCDGTLISGADGTDIGTGAQNTLDIVAGCITSGTAADYCAWLTLNGEYDWFLPSKDELNEMFLNIGQGNANGIILGPSHAFAKAIYWSSTEYGSNSVWTQQFSNGGSADGEQEDRAKTSSYRVRAIRAF
jgi:hypothetical protein